MHAPPGSGVVLLCCAAILCGLRGRRENNGSCAATSRPRARGSERSNALIVCDRGGHAASDDLQGVAVGERRKGRRGQRLVPVRDRAEVVLEGKITGAGT